MSGEGLADKALSALRRKKTHLQEYQKSILTEADTRCKIIDVLFKEILGWDEGCISREESVRESDRTRYVDYVFRSDKNMFLVEAKKAGFYFNLPAGIRKARSTGILSKDTNTASALAQAAGYCRQKEIQVGCICNGLQLVVFRIPHSSTNCDAYIFNGIGDIEDDFVNFISLLAPHGESVATLERLLGGLTNIREVPQFSKRIREALFNPNERISRNPIAEYILPVLNEFFLDLVSEGRERYLDECYCEDNRVTEYEKQLTALLRDELPRLEIPVQDSASFGEDFERVQKGMVFSHRGSDVMIVVGGVGAGKTTFLYRYFTRVLPEYIRKNVVWLHIDLLRQSSETIDIKEYIIRESLRQIREKYSFLAVDRWDVLQKIYRSDIVRLQRGPLRPLYSSSRAAFDARISEYLYEKTKDEVRFGEDVLRYLSTKRDYRKVVCLTIDNADQMSEDFQKRCVTAAFDFSKRIRSVVLLSMREESYWRLRKIQPFDAYQNFAYHISAPSVVAVLARRIAVAGKYQGKTKIEVIGHNGIRYTIKLDEFLKILADSLLQKSDPRTLEFFEALSANNVRFGQEMLSTFLVSGHTNTREYVETYFTRGEYTIPFHAFVRSIALGDYKYYRSNGSLLMNLFDIEDDGFYSHFTKVRVLKYLDDRKNLTSMGGKGWIRVQSMYRDFSEVCSGENAFRKILTPLLVNHLLEADKGYRISGEEADYVRITSAGYYYLHKLLKEFAYLERLCEDTPILSSGCFERIRDMTHAIGAIGSDNRREAITLRLQRTELFLEYLVDQERAEKPYIRNQHIDYPIMEEVVAGFAALKPSITRQ